MSDEFDEFYVGYLPEAPPGLGRFLRLVAVGLAVGVAAAFALVATTQDPQPSGVFEYGVERDFEGVLYVDPVPYLRSVEPAGAEGPGVATLLLLVGSGKHGLSEPYRALAGRRVAFRGSLIHRKNMAMVEAGAESSLRDLGPPGAEEVRPPSERLGEVALTGELVDTKCWLGVMRPASGKVHRACAVNCLRGGVPPGLLVHDDDGNRTVFLLVAEDAGPLGVDLELAGRSVLVRGGLELADGLPIIRVAGIERL